MADPELGKERQNGGAGGTRTRDPLLAKQVLYQLSYDPKFGRVINKEHQALKLTLYDQLRPRLLNRVLRR